MWNPNRIVDIASREGSAPEARNGGFFHPQMTLHWLNGLNCRLIAEWHPQTTDRRLRQGVGFFSRILRRAHTCGQAAAGQGCCSRLTLSGSGFWSY